MSKEGPVLETQFSSDVYSVDVVKKAAYRMLEHFSCDIQIDAGLIRCRLAPRRALSPDEAETLLSEFRDEVLDQDLRRIVRDETEPARNAILAYAFSKTGLQE
jgi:His-Xaa-Ser system protein HxsD